MASALRLILELKKQQVTHVIALPDNASAAVLSLLASDPEIRLLGVTREGEAFALAAGLWIGGKTPVVLIQNTGLLESGDSLRGTVLRMRIPLLCLITFRGYKKLEKLPDRTTSDLIEEVLSRAVTGRRPFHGETLSELQLAVFGQPFHLPGEAAEIQRLDAVLQKCLARDPQDRYSSADEMRRELIPSLRECPSLGVPAREAGTGDLATRSNLKRGR